METPQEAYQKKVKEVLLGAVIGAVGLVIGFFLYWLFIYLVNGIGFSYFWNEMFMGTSLFKSKILTGAILVDAIFFFIFMQKQKENYNYGILMVILLAVIAIVYFYAD